MKRKNSLSKQQKEIRKRILEVSFKRSLSHLGSCLSGVDLIDSVYKVKKSTDTFILSNGHAAIAWYVILEKNGILDPKFTNELGVHPDRNPGIGIEVSTGSLGHGLPIAVGMAIAKPKSRFFCLISDGECAEGSVWESLTIAHSLKLSNLVIIVNSNGWAAYDVVNTKSLIKRMKAFGTKLLEIDGHRPDQIKKALKTKNKKNPLIIIAKTSVEHLPFLKGQDAHYFVMNEEHYKQGLRVFD